ncbi:hypothetical protein BLA29_001246 [Euroglyphus maynei]|uniref:ABC transporter domain-containing protein n=1 Tax=Euroglyphus maynei TaxID=6958 RepID=A0A1Y3AXK8_EURMA|nr:hypothetical protein BLA29_001246 [Euroglyphus maynei]
MLKISCLEFTNAKVRKLADKTLLDEHQFLQPYLQELKFQPNIIDMPDKCFCIFDLFIQSFRQFRLLYLNRWFPLKLLTPIIYYLFLAYFLIDKKMIIANRCYDSISERLIVPSNQTCQQIIHEQIMIDGYVTYQMYSMWFVASWSILTTSLYCLKILNLFRNDYQNQVEFCRDKIQLAWRSLSLFSCCKKSNDKCDTQSNLILNNLNGQFRLGSMNAVIGGGSDNNVGCSRTNIMGCQNGNIRTLLLRIFSGQLKTRLTSDTTFYESQYATNNVCFISRHPQEHLISGLTAKQSLIYASTIKNIEDDDYSASRLDHEEMALNILDELDLGHRSGSYVDDCNQSERKRLALALELTSLQMPNLICFDEPIFGLDAINAEQFIRCLRQLTDRHSITFVVSFQHAQHQLLTQFDQIYCLSSNGHCIYSGPSTPQSIRQHLNRSLNPTTTTSSSCKRTIEELLRYSCMIDDSTILAIEQLVRQTDQQTLKADELLPQETTSLEHKGIKSNIASFSIISILRLSSRYRGRWFYSLWFHWIIYVAIISTIALLLNGLFGSEITKPDGCIRKDIFNATAICPQYRTGTKMIWDEDGEHLWDNYRYVYISTHLFLVIILFQSAMIFYQEIKIFLHEHQNGKFVVYCSIDYNHSTLLILGWYSSSVFYFVHFIWIDVIPIIPITMIYLYLIDIDHFDHHYYEPDEIVDNDRQLPQTYYWWAVILTMIATESIHSLSHLVVIISTNRIRSETIFLILFTLFGLLSITSNFQIQTKFTLSFLNVFRYLNEAILVLHYGYFNSCSSSLSRSSYIRQQQQPISLVLYRIDSNDLNPDFHFYHCLRVLIYQTAPYLLYYCVQMVIAYFIIIDYG